MTALTFADECNDLTLTLLQLRVELIGLRRDLMKRGGGGLVAKYRADQPRVPAGNPDGGQWSDGSGSSVPMTFEEWLAGGWVDAGPADSDWGTGEGLGEWKLPEEDGRVEQIGSRGRGGAGGWSGATPSQQARLAVSDVQAQAAIRRVQEIDSRWRPPASISEGIEGAISSNVAAVRQAEARLRELQGMGLLPGPFARESIPVRGPGRANAREQAEVNRIGRLFGCHTCGATEPGTRTGNYILDHQRPTALEVSGAPQRGFPHCQLCSDRQGGHTRWFKGRR